MTDEEIFSAVLRELSLLLKRLGPLGEKAVLIGGQVLAIEGVKRGGTGIIQATTDTGITVTRGFSLEPDLLIDIEADTFLADQLPEDLREFGYERVRDFRWSKRLEGAAPGRIALDLFRPSDVDPEKVPTPMTVLADGDIVLRRSVGVRVTVGSEELRIRVPDTLSFLTMKLRAKLEQRPDETRDSFDLYTYVQLHGPKAISQALEEAGDRGRDARARLKTLFWNIDSPGMQA